MSLQILPKKMNTIRSHSNGAHSHKKHISQVVIVCDAHLSAQNICLYGSFILNTVNGKRVSVQLTFS